MDSEYELKYHQLEEKHWWFASRRDMVLRLIKDLKLSKKSKILEIGCSGGPLLTILKNEGFENVFGIDISENAIQVSIERNILNTSVMDAQSMNFDSEMFDLVIASDILEHIEDDFLALNEWNRVLKIGGCLIVFVPAFQSLWSKHDEINHHFKRYKKNGLIDILKKSGFQIEKKSYWNFMLFLPSFFIRASQRLFKKSSKASDQLYEINSFINWTLIVLLKFENRVLKFIKFPFGVSVFAVSKKK